VIEVGADLKRRESSTDSSKNAKASTGSEASDFA